jgi:transposase
MRWRSGRLVVKKTTLYAERNEAEREAFRKEIEKYDPSDLLYVDESGLEESLCREYARALRGQEIPCDISGKRTQRISIIAGLNEGKPMAPFYFKGYCNTQVILIWVEKVLIPCLKKGMKVIWDRASFHLSPKIKVLIEAAGCELIFLPAYSPDLNPIENYWSALKANIRKIRKGKMSIPRALGKLFRSSD